MSFELSSVIIPSKFLIVVMQFILAVTTIAHYFKVISANSQEPQFQSGYTGTPDYQLTSKLVSVILNAIFQGLQIFMIFMSYNHFYHKLNILSTFLTYKPPL